jgi:uncharacterized protein YdeI (YjbR/CyaY-like superfamily)
MCSTLARRPEVNTFEATTSADWRDWLATHGASQREIWLVMRRKGSPVPGISYEHAVCQALCFGWIDGHHRGRDEHSSLLRFTPRTSRSVWSRPNRDRAARMLEAGMMTPAGRAAIDRAHAGGTWERVAASDLAATRAELDERLDRNPDAHRHFASFPPSSVRIILGWIASAKRADTRVRRMERTVELAAQGIRANHPGVRMS